MTTEPKTAPETPSGRSNRPLLLLFVLLGLGTAAMAGFIVISHYGNRHIDRCLDETSEQYIQDDAARAAVCGE